VIINHLVELIEMNQPVDLNQLVLPVRQQLIVKAMQAVGSRHSRVFEHLKESYTYDEIRLMRAWWLREKRGKLIAQICP